MEYPDTRLRRYRRTEELRRLFDPAPPGPEKFVWPVFIVEGRNKEIPLNSMPGQSRLSVDKLLKVLEPVVKSGVNSVMIFGVIDDNKKTSDGKLAWIANGIVQNAVRTIKKHYPQLIVFTDVCLCGYTDHGHCGILKDDGSVDNDSTLELLAKTAVSHAESGADGVGPSAMMDGQVLAIRSAFAENGFDDTILMSYSTKFASSMYGPFRDAVDSAPGKGDRKSYQLSCGNSEMALRESELDEDEGADILMVKPALFYLDIISQIKENSLLPLAAYNVSGEYSMIHAAAEKGYGELYPMAKESITAISRAGADIIISYWANQYGKFF